MNSLYLVGFMGTGKSSVGKKMAERLKRRFIDLDDLIELKAKKRISDIFAEDGEPYFRKLEKNTLREISLKDKTVVACGGGIVIDPENIEIMKQTGRIICLTASPEVILKRVSGTGKRPLLNVSDPKKQIELLLERRAVCYAQADGTIDTTGLSLEEVADKILKCWTTN